MSSRAAWPALATARKAGAKGVARGNEVDAWVMDHDPAHVQAWFDAKKAAVLEAIQQGYRVAYGGTKPGVAMEGVVSDRVPTCLLQRLFPWL